MWGASVGETIAESQNIVHVLEHHTHQKQKRVIRKRKHTVEIEDNGAVGVHRVEYRKYVIGYVDRESSTMKVVS